LTERIEKFGRCFGRIGSYGRWCKNTIFYWRSIHLSLPWEDTGN